MRDLANQVLKQAAASVLEAAARALAVLAHEQKRPPRMRSLGRHIMK